MTIREKGYLHWEGELRTRRCPWWPITRLGIKLAFKRKYFKFIYAGAFLPAFGFLAGIYAAEQAENFQSMFRGAPRIFEVNPKFFSTYFNSDFLFFMMLMIMVVSGAGLISDDLKFNSLQLYFARPLAKRDYLIGKMAVLVFFLLSLTLLPGVLFILFKLVFDGSFRFLATYPWLPLAVVVSSLLTTTFFCLYTLLLSSLSRNRRYVSILIFAVYFLSNVLFGFFYDNFRKPAFALISIQENLQQVGTLLFQQKPSYSVSWVYSFLILAGICLAAVLILHRRVKGVEVVR